MKIAATIVQFQTLKKQNKKYQNISTSFVFATLIQFDCTLILSCFTLLIFESIFYE